MNITYDYYRIFYYVAKYKSFTRAANILISNQPNITRSMNNLESQLGCRLFVRSNRGVSLTPEGEKLFKHVSIAFAHLTSAELELIDDKSLNSGIVTIATSETALHGILLPIIKKFHKTYPGIRIRITNHSTPQAIDELKNGLADFAVVTTPTGVTKPFKEIPLKSYKEILVCSSQYAFLSKGIHHLKDLREYPFISLSKNTKTYQFHNDFFQKLGLSLDPDIEAGTSDQIIPLIKSDLGIGFVPEHFAERELKNSEIFKIPLYEEIPERSICLIQDTSRPLSIAANKLKEIAES